MQPPASDTGATAEDLMTAELRQRLVEREQKRSVFALASAATTGAGGLLAVAGVVIGAIAASSAAVTGAIVTMPVAIGMVAVAAGLLALGAVASAKSQRLRQENESEFREAVAHSAALQHGVGQKQEVASPAPHEHHHHHCGTKQPDWVKYHEQRQQQAVAQDIRAV